MIYEGTITSCVYDKPWQKDSTATIIHYHRIELLNGDKGNVGTSEQMPDKIKVGTVIYYEINGNSIKLKTKHDFDNQQNPPSKSSPPNRQSSSDAPKKVYKKNPQDAITFIMGYASNRHVAKITALKKDVPLKEMLEDADKIFEHYLKMLNSAQN